MELINRTLIQVQNVAGSHNSSEPPVGMLRLNRETRAIFETKRVADAQCTGCIVRIFFLLLLLKKDDDYQMRPFLDEKIPPFLPSPPSRLKC